MPSFERLVADYGERAFQLAFHLTGNVEDARDLVQEVFYKALRGWREFDASRPVESWLFTILRNVYLDGLRRSARREFVSLDEPVEEDGDRVCETLAQPGADALLEALEREESGRAVRVALKRLVPEQRAVLCLADMDGLSYAEVAEVLDCPVGTVRSRISRARTALKALLEGEAIAGDRD